MTLTDCTCNYGKDVHDPANERCDRAVLDDDVTVNLNP